jgi:hypothetical protein
LKKNFPHFPHCFEKLTISGFSIKMILIQVEKSL